MSVLLAFDRCKVPEILRTLLGVACVVFVTPVTTAGTTATQHHVVFLRPCELDIKRSQRFELSVVYKFYSIAHYFLYFIQLLLRGL